ncbi:MAG: DUF4123 domain-containing protein [Candidatus Parabeggiatoa sp. nov. 3]|nr:MAG: DUF4123 domain-containing protein [Gammaproteobacteria bacterium]RKZ65693.1 MAG: DUF4123 domain-containing protein [Gammaproteobacteria bacterium]RKZ86548.1 MAG: DUF4123 domain-containing protein [Gammaproteobacteria bacterium]
MIQSLRETLYQLSFAQDKQLYVVLDAARVEEIPAQLFELEEEPEYFSLFFETPQEEMIDVAPYLVELEPNSELLTWILNEGWGQSWGIFLTAAENVELEELFEHLRSLLKVTDPEGEELFFRFYDPRVLRIFLPTCNAQELYQFFGPIISYIAEDDKAEKFLQFTNSGQSIEVEEISVFL